MTTPHTPERTPLGSPAWLNKLADEREEMLHAIGSIDDEAEKEDKQEILGLRDAARELAALQARNEELTTAARQAGKALDMARCTIHNALEAERASEAPISEQCQVFILARRDCIAALTALAAAQVKTEDAP